MRLTPPGPCTTVHVGTTRDRALRLLRAELATEDFEVLSLEPRDMTNATLRIDGAYDGCLLDSVRFTPCDPPGALPPGPRPGTLPLERDAGAADRNADPGSTPGSARTSLISSISTGLRSLKFSPS